MKFGTSLFQASLEEGPAKYCSSNEHHVLHRNESGTNCGKFVQIVKVILYIELIILIGWLGHVSFSYYNIVRNSDCGGSPISVGKSYVVPDEDLIPTQDQSYPIKRSITAESVPEPMTTKCWSEEQDKILKEEREERMDAFALRIMRKEDDYSYTKAYLKSIEAALNAMSVSEINTIDYPRKSHIHRYIESLSENSSLELRKEGCEINRDLHLEFYKLKNHSPEWNGYNQERIRENLTASNFFAVNFTKEALFNDMVIFGNAFNLRYEELGNRKSGDESNKPVFGKFTYVGEKPEKLGIRHLRHILDAFAKFYFKTQEPSSVCKDGTPTAGSVPESTNGKCWNMEQDPALLEERRERLEGYPIWFETYNGRNLYTKNYLGAISQALNATSASEIHFDDRLLISAPLLETIEEYAMNASLELHKEALELARDLYLEIEELMDHTSEWEGFDFVAILSDMARSRDSFGFTMTPTMIFGDFTRFADTGFKLRYEENLHTEKPVLGKVIYRGEEPEMLGVRHIRHILDGVVRFYFKVRYPSTWGMCDSTAQTSAKASIKKRSVPWDPVTESLTTKCWSEEEDKILGEERLERQKTFTSRHLANKAIDSYEKEYLKGIAAALNAKSISEMNLVQFPRKSDVQVYLEYLSENSSLELRKEAYEIDRDLYLEFYKLKNHSPEWDGYDSFRIHTNLTAGHYFDLPFTKEAFFNDFVRFGNIFNLRYQEIVDRESGDDPNKLVFGKFTFFGDEPEKPGERHLRHILDAFVKLYFKMHEPSAKCGSFRTAGPKSVVINKTCKDVEQDPVFLKERRERVENYPTWLERREAEQLYTKNYLDAIEQALNATNASEIHFDASLVNAAPLLWLLEYTTKNASLELHKEGLEIARDLYLEIEELKEHSSAWEGYDYGTILNNFTESSESNVWPYKTNPRTIFEDFTNFERAFKLRYDGDLQTDKPVLGKMTYYGQEPEKLGVRRIIHILNAVVRLYFKVIHPSIAPVCNSRAEGSGKTTEEAL